MQIRDGLSTDVSCDFSFQSLRDLYASRTASPVDVMRRVYQRIAARGADGVWIHLGNEQALLDQAARLMLQHLRGDTLPLYGMPFAVKDNIDVLGMPTTAACPAFAYMPEASAPAVEKLLAAGAICLGKVNLDQFATGLSGTRSPYGVCTSVFNPDYAAGGSSSGSAVAVGAGLVSFALGTDTGGSGRVPAAFNNVVGLKPTLGRVSLRGVVPNCRTLDAVSVFALTCMDAMEVLSLVGGFDAADPFSRPEADQIPVAATRIDAVLPGCRFGVPRPQDREYFGNREAAALYDSAIERLRRLGGIPVEVDFAPFVEAGKFMFDGPWVAERAVSLRAFLANQRDAMMPITRTVIETAHNWTAADAFACLYRLREIKRQTEVAIWQNIDVLMVPTTGTAYTVRELQEEPIKKNNHNGYYSYFVNLLDLCAVAVPNGFLDSSGVPMGITFIAPAWRDQYVASIGDAYHEALGIAPGLAGRSSAAT